MNDLSFQEIVDSVLNNPDLVPFLQSTLFIAAAAFVLLLAARFLLGGNGHVITKSVGAAMGILMIYVVTIVLTLSNQYEIFLTSLPYISIAGDYVQIFSFQGAGIETVCVELVNMIVLAFLVSLIDMVIPKGNSFIGWYFFRCVAVVLGMGAHWLIQKMLTAYLPGFIVTYAPVIILVLVVALLALTLFSWLVGTVLGIALNPVIGVIYTFVISNVVGKTLLKASLTTALLTALVWMLDQAGIHIVYLTAAAISAFLPMLLMVIVVWYLVFKFLD